MTTNKPAEGTEKKLCQQIRTALRIVQGLQDRSMRVKEMASYVGVQERAAYRYLNAIIAAGVDVQRDPKGRYRIMTGVTKNISL